ncbi:MAG: hypothetical protein KDD51_05460 [Bdellovibrionales bacterium]|nr:hypothetical protein [Bdellovibrionales bacterium]
MAEVTVKIYWDAARVAEIRVRRGATLRSALLEAGFSPYQGRFRQLNCKGLGLCGSCKVLVAENSQLWERRSCQIRCFNDLEIKVQ